MLACISLPGVPGRSMAIAAPSGGQCSRFNRVPAWHGNINISFSRSATTPNYVETANGGISYQVSVARPPFSVEINGYDQNWVGKPQGSGNFHVSVTNADGSPLRKPLAVDGSGAVLSNPPLGKFGPEQFWINTSKCVYAIYTSGALNARHSYEAPRVDGVSVHVEGIPVPSGGNVLSGSRTFTLPNRSNYSGGDQFFYPCVLVDWCNRGSGTGILAWSFTPSAPGPSGEPQPTPPGAIRCPNWSAYALTATSKMRNDVATAFKNHGDAIAYPDVSVVGSIAAGTAKIEVRLDANHRALPSLECANEAIANGSAGPQSLAGAQQLLLGAIQQANGTTRVTLRIVDVSTGQIFQSGLGDAPGTNDAAITAASAAALQALNVHISSRPLPRNYVALATTSRSAVRSSTGSATATAVSLVPFVQSVDMERPAALA
jgi:hypothetical protein